MLKKIILFLLIGSSIIDIGFGVYLNMLPKIYLMIYILIILQLDLLTIFFIKSKNKLLGVLGKIIGIGLIILFLGLGFILFNIQNIFRNVTVIDNEVSNYSLIVLKGSDYYNISDVTNKDLGILDTDNEYYNKALKELEEINTFHKIKYKNEYELAKGLLDKNIEVILLNEAYVSILNEGIENFEDMVRILDDTRVEVEVEAKDDGNDISQIENNITSVKNDEAFNVYISGIDTYGSIASVSRSDVNIIATINTNTSEILLTNVPRDMYVPLWGDVNKKDKLTHAGVYGINTSISTLENFLDIDISYYVRINFSSLIKIVDYIGGIDVYSEYGFKAGNRYYNSGMNYNLSGKEALAFSRNRYAFKDGDRQRGRNQEQVIAAIINKVTETKDIGVYYNLINTLQNSFQTNMERDTINGFISRQLENNNKWNIMFSDVNGYDSRNYTYSYPWQKLYVMEVDYSSLNEAKNKINNILDNN